MEKKIIDSLNNEITFVYDEVKDKVVVNNPAVDTDFHEVTRNTECEPDALLIEIEGISGEGSWEEWSDMDTRSQLVEFWMEHKKDQN